jgi:hypothetical protein
MTIIYWDRARLQVANVLTTFIEHRAFPGTGVEPALFWRRLATLCPGAGVRRRGAAERLTEPLLHRFRIAAKANEARV